MRARIRDVATFEKSIREVVASLRAAGSEMDSKRVESLLHDNWTTGSEYYQVLSEVLAPMCKTCRGDLRRAIKDCRHFALHHRRILGMD